jgi:hypothetical protein
VKIMIESMFSTTVEVGAVMQIAGMKIYRNSLAEPTNHHPHPNEVLARCGVIIAMSNRG